MPPQRDDAQRLPPQNAEAERCVLGSMIRDNAVIGDVVQILRSENFYSDAHQKIYRAVIALYDKGHPVDLVLLADALKSENHLEDIGGYATLAELWDAAPTAANAEYYARIVRDRAIVRSLIHAGNEILRDAYEAAQPAEDILEQAERKILDIAQMGITGQTFTLYDALREAYDRIDTRHMGGQQSISGLSTGYIDLDEITAGLQNSELIIVGARPSVGKTSYALNIVRNIVINEQQPVFFVSLEQSRIELAERLLCSQAKVDSHRLRKGHLSADDMQKLIDAGGVLRNAKLFIDDSPGQGMLRIAANARRLKLRNGIRLVVIDYLQLIEPDNRRDPRQEQVAQISRRLKFLARELQIPVVALAQVNRSSEDRQDHRPRLADLRESGCLAGDTLVTLADTGARVPIRELVGRAGFRVWALDEAVMKFRPVEVSNAFRTGRKPVYRLETRLGRVIRATGNHKFRRLAGWCRLDELRAGDQIASGPMLLRRSATAQGSDRISEGWQPRPQEPLTSVREIALTASLPRRGWISEPGVAQRTPGAKTDSSPPTPKGLHNRCPAVDTTLSGLTGAPAVSLPGVRCATPGSDIQPLRGKPRGFAHAIWDQIVSITPDGEEEVYDLTVPGPANFLANDIIVHNSIEQDADTVMLLHRPDRYEPGQHEGVVEVIVAKQRNGPTGEVTLTYLKEFMRFEDFAVGTPFDG